MTTRPVTGRTGTKGVPRGEREQLIVEAAIAEFSRATYAGASLAAIAAQADVSKTLIISYFGSKEAVYAACVTKIGTQIEQAVADVLNSPITWPGPAPLPVSRSWPPSSRRSRVTLATGMCCSTARSRTARRVMRRVSSGRSCASRPSQGCRGRSAVSA